MRPIRSRDKRLVDRLLAGEEAAYQELFTVQVPRLYRFALARLSGDADAAEDVVQASLIQGMRKLHTFRGEASLLTWLGTICLREISSYRRRRDRAPAQVPLIDEMPEIAAALEILEADDPDPEQEALRRELSRLVQATLDRLPERYADVLEWKYLKGLSVKEIATRLDTGPVVIQSLLARARNAFREGFVAVGGAAGLGAGLQPGVPEP